jgi:UDP-N-acetylglucosamine 2-epimerase (non-hydrolysing)
MQEKEVYISDSFKEKLSNSEKNHVHIIMIATKPDIVKQAPLYLELKKRKELVLLVHT